jgi:hypothetical protein
MFNLSVFNLNQKLSDWPISLTSHDDTKLTRSYYNVKSAMRESLKKPMKS